jgi:hypothetical protein
MQFKGFSSKFLIKPNLAKLGCYNGWPHLLVESSASVFWLNRVTQWFFGEPLQTQRTRCSLHQSLLMIQLPRSPDSSHQEATIHRSSNHAWSSPVRVEEPNEITHKGGKDRSVTKEHPED